MATLYSTPIYFVTVAGHPASQAVLEQLGDAIDKLEPGLSATRQFITATTPALLLQSILTNTITANLTVALFDAPTGTKRYKPYYLTQPDPNRPNWAVPALWSIKINTRQASNDKVVRNCAQQIAAWFCRNIKDAEPGQSYPWGPISRSERNILLQHLANNSHA